MTTLREAVQEFVADYDGGGCGHFAAYAERFRKLLAQPEPRNQCGETCERAKLCAVCARGLDGAAQTPCDIAEDGVCEVIDCCRKSPLILEALEIGYAAAQAEAAQYHAAMAGYRPERHAEMDADVQKIAKAITAVKAALAQEDVPETNFGNMEPVAYLYSTIAGFAVLHRVKRIGHAEPLYSQALLENDMKAEQKYPNAHSVVALYTAPPRREWQSLTNDEIDHLWLLYPCSVKEMDAYARAIEQALKEKNNG